MQRLLAATIWLAVAGCGPAPDADRLAPGDPMPAFELPLTSTGTLSDRDLAGKAVVLNFWATWCLPCRAEMPALERLHRAVESEGIQVVGISIDRSANLAREFLLQAGVTFPNALDPDGATAGRTWQVRAYPSTFLIGRDGRIEAIEIGPRAWDDPQNVTELRERLGPAAAR